MPPGVIVPGDESAVKGTVQFSKLLHGVVLLQEGPCPLSKQQLTEVATIIKGQTERQNSASYVRSVAEGLLSEAQRAFLKERYVAVRAQPGWIYHPAGIDVQKEFHQFLKARAGTDVKDTVKVPAGYTCQDIEGHKPVPYADLTVQYYRDLEADPSLRLTQEQARKLMVVYNSYTGLVYTDEQLVLGVLTTAQREQVDKAVSAPGATATVHRDNEDTIFRLANVKR